MPSPSRTLVGLTTIAALLLGYLYPSVHRRLSVLGFINTRPQIIRGARQEVVFIEDTIHCEDIHYLAATNELITACENNDYTRTAWFPGLGHLDAAAGVPLEGSLHVIDAITLKSRRLALENFPGPFITHGIDVVPDPSMQDAYFVYAINHLPNPEYDAHQAGNPKARSQIELFHYISGSGSAQHLRSIRHPLVTTPNDIHAVDGKSFFVTNDHRHREGFLRHFEDFNSLATWSTVAYVQVSDHDGYEPESGVEASIVLTGLHLNNGMGHGPKLGGTQQDEVLITSAGSGVLYRTAPGRLQGLQPSNLTILEGIELDSTLDNPSYFTDPYPQVRGDASGYILGGLAKAPGFMSNVKEKEHADPSLVWHVQKAPTGKTWTKRIAFADDGSWIRGATTAVMVPIDPRTEGGEKKGWLFVASVLGKNVIAVKTDLSELTS